MKPEYIILDRKELNKQAIATSFEAADAILRSWSRDAAPGGEDAHFVVIWRDGSYRGDYRMERSDRAPSLRAHMRRHIEFVAPFMTQEQRDETDRRLA